MKDIVYLTEDNYNSEAMESDVPVLVDFYADWCGPCKMVGPILEEMAGKYEGKAKICKINIDEQRKLAIANKVMSIPTLFFIKNGEIKERISGALPQTVLEEKLEALL
ncbi:thioredoxin [Sinanaerobacter chloroacetimidivorans]|jgi:thioredoxin 1|uniref:Thioredoxin n=1 Tax=Sinanaerobacter chloroacetimidivorans TaxID=2818044 RepID=A0A8J7W3W0_9FIRM|nr:thioredoxin [Sinanaerobacter chloroacetimidivorans]MBR0598888.1 thioredoxin [Sinanaerobacter chloroacetimidivorans]